MLQENCNSQDFCIFPSSLHPFLAPCIYSQLPTFFPKSLLLSPSPCIFFLAPCIFANSAFPPPPVLCIFPHLPASFSIFLHFPLALPASFPSSASFPGSLRIFPALYIFSQIPAFSPPAPCIFPLLPASFPCSQHVSPAPSMFPLFPSSFPCSLHLFPPPCTFPHLSSLGPSRSRLLLLHPSPGLVQQHQAVPAISAALPVPPISVPLAPGSESSSCPARGCCNHSMRQCWIFFFFFFALPLC